MIMDSSVFDEIVKRLARIEAMLDRHADMSVMKDWYSTAELAEQLGRADWTVREWCRLGRIYAEKRASGRGPSGEWMISHTELQRIRNEGLLPLSHRDRTSDSGGTTRARRNHP